MRKKEEIFYEKGYNAMDHSIVIRLLKKISLRLQESRQPGRHKAMECEAVLQAKKDRSSK